MSTLEDISIFVPKMPIPRVCCLYLKICENFTFGVITWREIVKNISILIFMKIQKISKLLRYIPYSQLYQPQSYSGSKIEQTSQKGSKTHPYEGFRQKIMVFRENLASMKKFRKSVNAKFRPQPYKNFRQKQIFDFLKFQ